MQIYTHLLYALERIEPGYEIKRSNPGHECEGIIGMPFEVWHATFRISFSLLLDENVPLLRYRNPFSYDEFCTRIGQSALVFRCGGFVCIAAKLARKPMTLLRIGKAINSKPIRLRKCGFELEWVKSRFI